MLRHFYSCIFAVLVLTLTNCLVVVAGDFQHIAKYPYETKGIVVGDFNNDGKFDVAACGSAGADQWGNSLPLTLDDVGVFLGTGDGQLRAPVVIPASLCQSGMVAVDVNRDGNLDLVMHSGSDVIALLGRGDGTFEAPQAVAHTLATLVVTSVVVDTPGDYSTPDYNSTIPVILQGGGGAGATAKVQLSIGTIHRTVLYVTVTNGGWGYTSPPAVQFIPPGATAHAVLGLMPAPDISDIVVGDLNQDGIPDLVALAAHGQFVAFTGLATGGFAPGVGTSIDLDFALTVWKLADLNGDGKADLLLRSTRYYGELLDRAQLRLGNGDGTFASPVSVGLFGPPLAVADLNSDGKLDLVESSGQSWVQNWALQFGNGDGTFAAPIEFSPGLAPTAAAVADFNGDGRPDLAISHSTGSSPQSGQNGLTVLWGNGDGTFAAPVGYASSLSLPDLTDADLNQDGLPDLIASGLVVLLNDKGSVGARIIDAGAYFQGDLSTAWTPKAITVTSTGSSPLNVSAVSLMPPIVPFHLAHNCLLPLPTNASCTIAVSFTPQTVGHYTGSIVFQDNSIVPNEILPLVADVSSPQLQLSATLLRFPNQKLNTGSTPQNVTVTNATANSLSLIFSVSPAGNFILSQSCPYLLASGSSCTLGVIFNPTVPGTTSATLTINQYSVALVGTGSLSGAIVEVAPASLTFGKQFVGTSSAPQTVLVSDPGDLPATISGVTSTAGFAVLNACGSAVQPGQSCSVGVFFSPQNPGPVSGELTISEPAGPHTVALTGTAVDIEVKPSTGSSMSQSVAAGQSATYILTLNPQFFTGTVNIACSGAPLGSTCTTSTPSLDLSAATTVTVIVATTSRTAAANQAPPRPGIPYAPLTFAITLLGAIVIPSRAGRSCAAARLVLTLGIALLAVSCGEGGSVAQVKVNPNGTPTGSYALTLALSTGSSTVKSTTLTLNVQ